MSVDLSTRTGAESDTLALVDAALRRSRGRELYTRDEARKLLCKARDHTGDVVRARQVASVVDDALAGFGNDRFIERRRVVDPLLDIRLALSR